MRRLEALEAPPIRVLIVDDHEVVRTGLLALLKRAPGMCVVGAVGSAEQALAVLDHVEPDVVILDFQLPGMNGAEVCAVILRRRPRTAVLILTTFPDDEVLRSCISAGARGFLTKSTPAEELEDAVRRLARCEAVLGAEVIPKVIDLARVAKASIVESCNLTPGDLSVLRGLATGASYRDISIGMGITEGAVRSRMNKIRRRLGASDRAHAVALAARQGLV